MNEKKGFYNERTGLIILLVGLVIFILAFFFMNPLGTGLGVSESPGRHYVTIHLCHRILSTLGSVLDVEVCTKARMAGHAGSLHTRDEGSGFLTLFPGGDRHRRRAVCQRLVWATWVVLTCRQ